MPRGPHRQFTSGLLAFFQASQDVPHCDYFKVICFLIIESIRTNFTLEKAADKRPSFLNSANGVIWKRQPWPVLGQALRVRTVVQSLGLVVRTTLSLSTVTGCSRIFARGCLEPLAGHPPRSRRTDGQVTLPWVSRLRTAPLGLYWMGHASLTPLILCLFVKGQNMRLPNKI